MGLSCEIDVTSPAVTHAASIPSAESGRLLRMSILQLSWRDRGRICLLAGTRLRRYPDLGVLCTRYLNAYGDQLAGMESSACAVSHLEHGVQTFRCPANRVLIAASSYL